MPLSPLRQPQYYGEANSSTSSLVPLNPLNPIRSSAPSPSPSSSSSSSSIQIDSEDHDGAITSNSNLDSDRQAHDQTRFTTHPFQRSTLTVPTAANSTGTAPPLLPRPLFLSASVMGKQSGSSRLAHLSTSMSGNANVKKPSWKLVASYVTDWVVLLAFAIVAWVLGDIEPLKRPFSLDNETIAFPYKEKETVPVEILYITNGAVPILIVAAVALIFVPGPTVPKGTPRSLIWKRKLWELHTGWLGLILAMCAAMFVTNGLKNMFGKPRPDLISRCKPDLAKKEDFLIGAGLLVTHAICTETDTHMMDDGFRSFPSGHSSSSAAGLIYLSLFIASKFTITIPFVTPAAYPTDASFAAFPSRLPQSPPSRHVLASTSCVDDDNNDSESQAVGNISSHSRAVLAVRRQAAAPPLYLFAIALLPFFGSVFIASSRWFDYRHHAFDIFSGYLIGTLSAILGFRYYHMPISQGAGWSWGPRSVDKAFWAGLGSYSFATDKKRYYIRAGDEEDAIESSGRTFSHNDGTAQDSLSRNGSGMRTDGMSFSPKQPPKSTILEGESTSIQSRAE
ncbi:uncharacterized protein MKZ38_005665 [Zalerion maritima]|uniref:Phosphatidic acid phosphatase type 2/haloperoxidase domain-containing protein n=1 Tax=Zalerion maritima TaxID=339359 RepID=A0AAD5WU69_9PEZI|nr:uncharacterized protein MKZ38_005665 [Zalerion maritima]